VTDPGKAVFISYASQDTEAARHLCNALRAAGIEVWFDQSELRGGDAWDQKIRQQVKGCHLFVPIISANTQAREEGYFRREWKLAVDRTHDMAEDRAFLLPIVIDGTSDSDARVPEKFREVQWTRLPGGANTDAFVDRVRRLVSTDAATSTAANAQYLASTRSTPPASRSFVPWIVGAALLLATGYFVTDKFVVSRHAVPAAESPATAHAHAEAVGDKSIAVLPFTDMSERHDQEYFGDGMAEEILDELARIPQLKVISRTSSFQYKGRNADVRSIGQALGARYIVEGTVRRAGDQIRVTAKLVDAADGSERWVERFERKFGDVFNVQDQIAASLARALEVSMGASEGTGRGTLRVPAAYEAYLRARRESDGFDRKGFETAVELYREALRLDPQFARAAAALANLQMYMVNWGYLPVESGFADARKSAELAIGLDPSLADPHDTLAGVMIMYDWEWNAAEGEIAKARALEPRNHLTEQAAAQLAEARGEWDEARRHIDAAIAIDPLIAIDHYFSAEIRLAAGRTEEAETEARRILEISQSYAWARYLLAKILVARARPAEAIEVIQTEPDDEGRLYGIAVAQFAAGHRAASDNALQRLTALAANDWAFGIAAVHASRGEADDAFRWLERGYTQRDADLNLLKANRQFDPVRSDARYAAFLRKMNLPE
jgi:TolB-like protein